MGMFSRKTKAKQEEKKTEPQVEEKTKQPTKFVPRHVATQRANGGDSQEQNSIAARRRMQSFENSLNTSSFGQGLSSPSTPTGSRLQNTSHGLYGEDGFFSLADARSGSSRQRSQSSHTGKVQLGRSNTESYSSNVLGKRPVTADYYASQYSSDSGYESADPASALHSRAPSERDLYTIRSSYGHVLPELRLGDDTSTSLDTKFLTRESSNEGNQKPVRNVSPIDLNADTRSIKSTKSTASVNKRTRFQDQTEPMPADHMDQIRKNSDQSARSSPQLGPQREAYEPIDYHNMMKLSEPQPSQSKPSTAQPFSALKHSRSLRRGSVPPLHILEGFKVNKKGKILDEEGEPIGHLVEGDLLDCVRQKANSQGEVLDEYGRVVGRVQTLAPPPSPGASPISGQPRAMVDTYRPTSQAPSVTVLQPPSEPVEYSRPPQSAKAEQSAPPPPIALPPTVPHAVEEESEDEPTPRGRRPSRENIPHVAHVQPPERPALAPNGFYPQEDIKMSEHESKEGQSSDDEMSQTNSRDFAPASAPAAQAPVVPMPTQLVAESSKRPARTASERSLSELSKPYARPAMSSVPENNVPEEDAVSSSANLFAYKGEIPTVNEFAQHSARMRSKSPNGPVPPASAYAMPGPSNYMKMAVNHPAAAGWQSMRPMPNNVRRATTQLGPGPSNRQALHPALKKTASMGYDTSPNASDAGTDPSPSDDGPMPSYTFGGHSRAASVGTTASVSKPRTYFTHAGRVTVEPKPEGAENAEESNKPAAAPAVKTADKKKSRMSLPFGRKTKAAA